MPQTNKDGQLNDENSNNQQKLSQTCVNKSKKLNKEEILSSDISEQIQNKLTKDCVDPQILDQEHEKIQIADGVEKINVQQLKKQMVQQQRHADYCDFEKIETMTDKLLQIQQKVKNHQHQIRALLVSKCAKQVKMQVLLKEQNASKEVLHNLKENCNEISTSANQKQRTKFQQNKFKKLLKAQTQILIEKCSLDELANKLKKKQELVKEIEILNQCLKSEVTQSLTAKYNSLCCVCVKNLKKKDADFIITQMCQVNDQNSCQIEKLLQFNNYIIKQVTELQEVTIMRLWELETMQSWPCVEFFLSTMFAYCTYRVIVTMLHQ